MAGKLDLEARMTIKTLKERGTSASSIAQMLTATDPAGEGQEQGPKGMESGHARVIVGRCNEGPAPGLRRGQVFGHHALDAPARPSAGFFDIAWSGAADPLAYACTENVTELLKVAADEKTRGGSSR
jgi:hypothetical protein